MAVVTGKILTLEKRMALLGVREEDIVENFIRSSGPGGQNVNKVETAVRLIYKRESMDIKCMEERSQLLNRVRAREILAERIEKKREDARLSARAQAEKIRKQKAGRPKAVKRRILENKRKKSQVKKDRKWRPGRDD